ncbi:MAG: hypothetical protein EXQ47_10825 [Bryobacterales bacterium]|nr:hypothetical protein [Bryobacterales bacterium]
MKKTTAFLLILTLAASATLVGAPKPKPAITLNCGANCVLGESFTVIGTNFDPGKSYLIYATGCGNPIQEIPVVGSDGNFETIATAISCAGDWTFDAYVKNRNGSPTHSVARLVENF